MAHSDRRGEYDSEPVAYCAKCYSLRIMREDAMDCDYCADCGSTEVLTTSIDEWQRLYEGRYGRKFVEAGSNPRESKYFGMSLRELKTEVYNRGDFREIIHSLYPGFPEGLSITESVIVLFGRLGKDGRLDELRYLLSDMDKKGNNGKDKIQ